VSPHLGAPLQVKVRAEGDAHVVEVSGDLVITNRDTVREAIEGILEKGAGKLIVDASRLSHVDTPSLSLLVQLADACRAAGGALVVAGLPPAFAPLARELRLAEALSFADSVELALERDGA
jgi:anti-anti-sigma factor